MNTPHRSLITVERLLVALQASWLPQTCFDAQEWSAENPARGQCVVSSLVVQSFLGGDLLRYAVQGPGFEERHYCNVLPDGTVLDMTGSQYKVPVTLTVMPVVLNGFASVREKRLAEPETRAKYTILLKRVEDELRAK